MVYIDVIIPLPLPGLFTYVLPDRWHGSVAVGSRVVVPFGPRKLYAAFVSRIYSEKPEVSFELKEVADVIDETPMLLSGQLDFWEWMAEYYLCAVGDVCKAALPSGVKLESESSVERNEDYTGDTDGFTDRELVVWNEVPEGTSQTVDALVRRLGKKASVLSALHLLLERGAVRMKEQVSSTYRPRMEVCVKLCEPYLSNEHRLAMLCDALKRAPKQLAVLLKYVELSGLSNGLRTDGNVINEVPKRVLKSASGASEASLVALRDRGVLATYTRQIGRLETGRTTQLAEHHLTSAQQQAFDGIVNSFSSKPVCLLHGVTSSGKTEVYIHLIKKELEAGRQVLYLLPEIALTTQITERLRRVFGNRMGVYHSKFPDAERVELWKKQLSDQPFELILGVRSALFLPFSRLGLVIVDEEHEPSYKQQDPAPRYHARDAAVVLAAKYNARVLLGTATPSLESYTNACSRKYGLVELFTRYGDIRLPQIQVEDVAELRRKKQMKTPFSPLLTDAMNEALAQGEQVILFQNRRGYAPFLECRTCGWVPRCVHCDVSLTYHHAERRLVCHYCGNSYPVPVQCPNCGDTELRDRGFGTEKIEEAVQVCFPEARTARMDMDTTRSRMAYERIISQFQQGTTNVLIGTQMVSKGLDFDRVRVVGILDADTSLNVPDFRSHERAFQLMAQVAGRAGRRDTRGLVILQTRQPDLPVIRQVTTNDYIGFYQDQLAERELFRYPPFYRIIYIYLKHRQQDVVDEAAGTMATALREAFGGRLLGPDAPPVARIFSLHIRKMVLKVENGASVSAVRRYLRAVQQQVLGDVRFRSVTIYYDVDPL